MYKSNKIYVELDGWFKNKGAIVVICYDKKLLLTEDFSHIPENAYDDIKNELGFGLVQIMERGASNRLSTSAHSGNQTEDGLSILDLTGFVYGRHKHKGKKWNKVMDVAKQYIDDVILKDEI